MISDQDKLQIKGLYVGPLMGILNNVLDEMVKDVNERSRVSDSEWETVRKTLMDEGEMRGLKRFQQRLFDISSSV